MSASTTMTRRPPSARAIARLAVVFDLPSPAAALVMPTVCIWRSAYANWRVAARLRYASAAGECGSASIINAPPDVTGVRERPLRETVAIEVGPSGEVGGGVIAQVVILPLDVGEPYVARCGCSRPRCGSWPSMQPVGFARFARFGATPTEM